MVFEKTRKPCMAESGSSGSKYQSCGGWRSKTIYEREIKDREPVSKEVETRSGIKSRMYTKHIMKWVKVGTLCLYCHHIDYDPAWLEANDKRFAALREYKAEEEKEELEAQQQVKRKSRKTK